jgi:TusA-related sulfurtransferase
MTMSKLDLTGAKCPISIIKINRAMRDVDPGSVLVVRTDDPETVKDLTAFCGKNGHKLSKGEDGDYYVVKA